MSDPPNHASWHDFGLSGLDLESQGTWLGVSKRGTFAFVTNRWAPEVSNKKTRGEIVPTVLTLISFADISEFLATKHHIYTPFNLVYGNMEQVFTFTSGQSTPVEISAGIHTISSGSIDEPRFKNDLLKKRFEAMFEPTTVSEQKYFEILKDQSLPPVPEPHLMDLFPEAVAQKVGAIFVDIPSYGTRTSTVLTITNTGRVEFSELSHDASPSVKRYVYEV